MFLRKYANDFVSNAPSIVFHQTHSHTDWLKRCRSSFRQSTMCTTCAIDDELMTRHISFIFFVFVFISFSTRHSYNKIEIMNNRFNDREISRWIWVLPWRESVQCVYCRVSYNRIQFFIKIISALCRSHDDKNMPFALSRKRRGMGRAHTHSFNPLEKTFRRTWHFPAMMIEVGCTWTN